MPPEYDQPGPGLQPPRFGLSTLLVMVAMLGFMFAIIHYIGLYGFVIAIFFLACVMAHVFGNAIGTRLRDLGSRPPPADPERIRGRTLYGVTPTDFAPATQLGEKHALSGLVMIITAVGATCGGVLGGLGLLWIVGEETTWPVIVLGGMACAVLSGIWTFIASGFFQVTLSAWLQASREPRRRSDPK